MSVQWCGVSTEKRVNNLHPGAYRGYTSVTVARARSGWQIKGKACTYWPLLRWMDVDRGEEDECKCRWEMEREEERG